MHSVWGKRAAVAATALIIAGGTAFALTNSMKKKKKNDEQFSDILDFQNHTFEYCKNLSSRDIPVSFKRYNLREDRKFNLDHVERFIGSVASDLGYGDINVINYDRLIIQSLNWFTRSFIMLEGFDLSKDEKLNNIYTQVLTEINEYRLMCKKHESISVDNMFETIRKVCVIFSNVIMNIANENTEVKYYGSDLNFNLIISTLNNYIYERLIFVQTNKNSYEFNNGLFKAKRNIEDGRKKIKKYETLSSNQKFYCKYMMYVLAYTIARNDYLKELYCYEQ